MKKIIAFAIFYLSCVSSDAQVLTAEDSLQAGVSREKNSAIAGYGEAYYQNNTTYRETQASLKRHVLFVGYKFNKKISLFTELEIEDALLNILNSRGSIGMEQAFIKMNLNPKHYFVAGLFIPRFGIINENHLSTTFNSVHRPYTEQLIIPTTWREIGIGYYGQFSQLDNLYLSATIQGGLNSENFGIENGIANGRQQGSISGGNSLSHTISLLYYKNNLRLQTSQYIGGSTALNARVADSLLLNNGVYANPVSITEANIQYFSNAWTMKILAAYGNIYNADNINTVFANNTPSTFAGGYAELAYNIAPLFNRSLHRKVNLWTRYEYTNTNLQVPLNGIKDGANNRNYWLAGICYKPVQNISLKANYVQQRTQDRNESLIITPFPVLIPYAKVQHIWQLGIGYNF